MTRRDLEESTSELMSQYVWGCVWLFWHETSADELAAVCFQAANENAVQ